MKYRYLFTKGFLVILLLCGTYSLKASPISKIEPKKKARVIVSTDIGGTDPDDFQSMIHYLMYADRFQTEGLISSPYGEGRKEGILEIIDLYEKDLPRLKEHSDFPEADELRAVVKQGATEMAPARGWNHPSEGSDWIIKKAREGDKRPLWVLVWGGLEDLAQALHDAPEISPVLRVYWIGGPNKKWSRNTYLYLAENFPDLWMIEANSTYRGWFVDDDLNRVFSNDGFFENHMKERGAMGHDFGNYYKGEIKMGDTPSVAYLLNGDPEDPASDSWGGSFEALPYSAVRRFDRPTTSADTVPAYALMEWAFSVRSSPWTNGNPEIWMEIDGQRIDGFYEGGGLFKVRFVPKQPKKWKYTVHSSTEELDGETGGFTSVNPWPGDPHPHNLKLNNWWSDRTDPDMYMGIYPGAGSVSTWRGSSMLDWAERLSWLENSGPTN